MNKDTTEIDDVLDRVHREARPGSDVDILMVKIMRGFIQRGPVCDAVRPVEMEQPPQLNAAEKDDEIDRLLPRIDIGYHLVGVGPHHQDFIGGPGDSSTDTTPEHIVPELVLPEEFPAAFRHPVRRVLVFQTLSLERPEFQMPPTHNDDKEDLVSNKHFQNPVHPELHTP